jgi:hypothetical protein
MDEEGLRLAQKRAEESTLEAMVTGLEVNSGGELCVRFRNLGAVYFPEWEHLFVTEILGKNVEYQDDYFKNEKKEKELLAAIKANPKINTCKKRKKDIYWKIWQMLCPISLKKELPKREYIDKEGEPQERPWFITGHYTQQARWRLCNPANYVKLDDFVVYGLKRQRQIEKQTDALRNKLSEYKSGGQLTQVVNDLEKVFDGYDGKNWADIKQIILDSKKLAKIDKEIIEARREVADQIRITNERLEGKLKLTYEPRHRNNREHELRLEQEDFSYLEREWKIKKDETGIEKKVKNPGIRMPSGEELLKKKWMFLDIEIPHFRKKTSQISWVGVTYVENGKETREIHTIHDTGEKEINGYKIYKYASEEELVKSLTERVRLENPDFVSAYNHKFDLAKLRESSAGFKIGEDETNPLYSVTTQFFEKLKIKDRIVIDPYSWAKMARAFGINKKLEMVAGFEKEIDYDEMERLESISLAGGAEGIKAGRTIASYLTGDVTNLVNIWKLPEFRNNFSDACVISDKFGVGLERLMHSPNCINDIQEKIFFEVLGIYRDNVPPHFKTKVMQYKKAKAKQEVKDRVIGQSIEFEDKPGLFKNVQKVYIPVGEIFKDLISVRFPKLKEFYEYKDQLKGDKKRTFFLEQFGKEFARWIMEDYGAFIQDVRRFDSMISGVDSEKFEDAYHSLREKVLHGSWHHARKLDEAELCTEAVRKYTTPEVDDFLRVNIERLTKNVKRVLQQTKKIEKGKELSDYEVMGHLANARSDIKRHGWNIVGNYAVYPTSGRFFDADKKEPRPLVVDEVVGSKFKEINDFIKTSGIEVISQEGAYMYVTGNIQALQAENSPLVPVEDIPVLFNADAPYYSKVGYKSHMKNEKTPNFHYNVFEMQVFNEMLDNLLAGKSAEACQVYEGAVKRLKQKQVDNRDLVLYNKSKGRYVAYTPDGEKGRMAFIDDPEKAIAEIKEDEKGRRYFEEEIDTGKTKKKNETPATQRVYVMPVESVNLSLDKYIERFEERGEAILAPVRGGQLELSLE